jgi:hypothetical protein
MMNKYIRTIFLLNKPKTFLVAKPFNNSISHGDTLLLVKKNQLVPNFRLRHFDKWMIPPRTKPSRCLKTGPYQLTCG